jgi:phosphatidylserine/phosphatidylglycerophosphate/cardiolipin synthase-like enzyme
MTQSFPGVPAKVLAAMGRGLAEGTLPLEAPRLALQRLGLSREAEASAVAELQTLRGEGWNAQGIARWLGALAAERARVEGAREDLALVWSGPETVGAENRDSARVLEELFAGATESLLIAGFNFQAGEHFDTLAAAMAERPALTVEVYAHVFIAPGDDLGRALGAHDAALKRALGAMPLARVRCFRPSGALLDAARDRRFNLHAKCVVADRRRVLVTSANFTFTAQERNVELGLRLDDPHVAERVHAQFEGLVKRGHMVAHSL